MTLSGRVAAATQAGTTRYLLGIGSSHSQGWTKCFVGVVLTKFTCYHYQITITIRVSIKIQSLLSSAVYCDHLIDVLVTAGSDISQRAAARSYISLISYIVSYRVLTSYLQKEYRRCQLGYLAGGLCQAFGRCVRLAGHRNLVCLRSKVVG